MNTGNCQQLQQKTNFSELLGSDLAMVECMTWTIVIVNYFNYFKRSSEKVILLRMHNQQYQDNLMIVIEC